MEVSITIIIIITVVIIIDVLATLVKGPVKKRNTSNILPSLMSRLFSRSACLFKIASEDGISVASKYSSLSKLKQALITIVIFVYGHLIILY